MGHVLANAAGGARAPRNEEEEGKAGAAALDERLSLISPIARAAPDATLPLLCQVVKLQGLGGIKSHWFLDENIQTQLQGFPGNCKMGRSGGRNRHRVITCRQ